MLTTIARGQRVPFIPAMILPRPLYAQGFTLIFELSAFDARLLLIDLWPIARISSRI